MRTRARPTAFLRFYGEAVSYPEPGVARALPQGNDHTHTNAESVPYLIAPRSHPNPANDSGFPLITRSGPPQKISLPFPVFHKSPPALLYPR